MTMLGRLAFILRYVNSDRMRSRVRTFKIVLDKSLRERCSELV